MKRNILFGSFLAAALSVGAAAQSASPQTPPAGSRDQASTSSQTVTVTGCLKSGSASPSATGTAGSTAGAAGASTAGSFILADATTGAAGGAMGAPAGTTGSAPKAGASAASGKEFKLTGGNKDDLQKYVNSKVEIRGKIDSAAGGAMGGAPSPASPGAEPASPGAAPASPGAAPSTSRASGQTLQVESVRQVAPSCS
jgi:hypothetical protein